MSQSIPATHTHVIHEDDHHARIRWAGVIAGIFGTLSLLAVLTVLGAAIGLSVADRNSDAHNFALGAGTWGMISALIAFAFGGWLAVRSSERTARDHCLLQSGMVWMVSLALLTYMLGSGVGSLVGKAAQGAVANPDVTHRVTNDGSTGSTASTGSTLTADSSRNTPYVDPASAEQAADRGAKTAWGTLAAMLLGLGASLAGGYVGARNDNDGERHMAAPAASTY